MTLRNNAGTSFDRLVVGPEATASWPAIRNNGTTLQIRLGDHSDWAPLSMGNATFNGTVFPATDNATDLGSGSFRWKDLYLANDAIIGAGGSFKFGTSRSRIDSTANGVISFRTATAGNMTRVLFGTGDGSGPALSFSGTTIQATDGLGALTGFSAATIDLGAASDTTLARSAAGVVTIEGVKIATQPATETLSYSGTTVTVTSGKGPNQSSLLVCTNDFTLAFDSLSDNAGGTIWVHPAATNCTVTLPSYVYGPSGSTLTIAGGGATPTNHSLIAWKITTVNSTNVIDANVLNYYR